MDDANPPQLPALIEAMLRPEFYPHPVEEPIALQQTYAAYVVLTGQYAYKIKKPLDLGFLNFSTLERRRHCCAEELRLNRRQAGDLYLAVLPIGRRGDGYGFAQDGEPAIEYALKMRQFPQSSLLSALFERGELTVEHAGDLGRQVAAMHRAAPADPAMQDYGSIEAIGRIISENYRTTRAYVGRDLPAEWFEQIAAFTADLLERRGDWFRQRQSAGMIRECHGDLHLNNACQIDGRIVLFDCIEFTPAFRTIDVIYDAAFLLMDLEVRGRTDLAYEFLNAYLEQTGDYRGVLLLPLYAAMRAYIRGKASSLLSDDPQVADGMRADLRRQAARYYRHAWAATRPRQGRLVAMMGLSGSGKSSVARALARREGAILLRSDVLRKHLAGVPLDQPAPASAYGPASGRACYDRLLELGLLLAAHGQTVILDAKYDRRDRRAALIAAAQAAGLPLRLIHCDAPAAVLRERVMRRRGDVSDASVEVLARQVFEPLAADEAAITTVLDTTAAIDRLLEQIAL